MIESVNNEKIKGLAKLKEKKYQDVNKMFLVEGEHLVEEANKSGVLSSVFALENTNYDYDNINYVSINVMKKLTSLTSIPPIIGVAKYLEPTEISGNVILIDRIQDPGNMGTIMRSALAFNINTIILSPGTVSIYNPKVVRASEGALFYLNVITLDLTSAINKLKENDYKIYTTNVVNGKSLKDIHFAPKSAIIIGNEGSGVKEEVSAMADENIYIKMSGKTESLNAGVAASIILYELNRHN